MSKLESIDFDGTIVEAKTKRFTDLARELTRMINQHVKEKTSTVGEIEIKAAHRDSYEEKVDALEIERQKYIG